MKFPTLSGSKVGMFFGLLIVIAIIIYFAFFYGKGTNVSASQLNFGPNEDLIMFYRKECPWCKKTCEMMNKENTLGNFKLYDIETIDGSEKAKALGVTGLPSFVSLKLRTGVTGHRDSTKEIINELSSMKKEGFEDTKIILFTTEQCPWCSKAKEIATSDMIIIDKNSQQAKDIMEKFKITVSGVPHYFNPSTGKSKVGFTPDTDALMKSLK